MNHTPLWDWAATQTAPQPNQDSDLLRIWGHIPGLPELLKLRQVHALEHATVWILSEMAVGAGAPRRRTYDNETLGGLSTERGFFLYGRVPQERLRRAVGQALWRFRSGEWDLAIHPRCGTNASVALLVAAGSILAARLLLPRLPLIQLGGMVVASLSATQIAPDLGVLAQKYLTTAVPFNLQLVDISETRDWWGRRANFVCLEWQELQ